jgi:uncharacterized membrane protein
MRTSFSSIVLTIISTFVAAIGQLFYKLGAELDVLDILDIIFNQNIFITLGTLVSDPVLRLGTILLFGFIFYGVGAVLLVLALRKGELSVVYPIFAANYIWVILLSQRYLGEFVSISNWLGILFIIIGISFIGYGSTVLEKHKIIERFGIKEETE